jgi:DNA (cytosine-5)-methyltransferase 1
MAQRNSGVPQASTSGPESAPNKINPFGRGVPLVECEGVVNVLSLFAGIGGLELGLERAGMRVVGQVEIDPFCRSVLATHWPEVPRHDDVRTAGDWWASTARPPVDLVCGGFPCQPFSSAGRRQGVGDERWGWPWMEAVIRLVRPRYVVVENVAALLDDSDAFGLVLSGLAALGFDAEWSVLSACAVGAPHTRERLFVVAYTHGGDGQPRLGFGPQRQGPISRGHHRASPWRDPIGGALEAASRPDRVADGSPRQMVKAGGNAVVPQVAEFIGRLVMGAESGGWSA